MSRLVRQWKRVRHALGGAFDTVARLYEGRRTGEFVSVETTKKKKRLFRVVLNAVFAAAAGYILTTEGPRSIAVPLLRQGEISDQNIVAPLTIDLQNKQNNNGDKEELSRKVAPVFDYDDSILDAWLQGWKEAFRKIREEFYSKGTIKKGNIVEALSQRLQELTGQSLIARDVLFLHQHKFAVPLETLWVRSSEPLLGRLIAPTDLFPSYYGTGIVVRQVNQALNETLVHDVSRIWSVDHAREFVRHIPTISDLPGGKKEIDGETLRHTTDLLASLVVSNLKFNPTATQKRISNFLGQTQRPVLALRRGEIFVRRGERITETHAAALQQLVELGSPRARLQRLLLVSLGLFLFLSVLSKLELTKFSFVRTPLKDVLVFLLLALLQIACTKLSIPYLRLAFNGVNQGYGVEYLLPFSAGGLLIHLLMGREMGYSYALLLSFACGFLTDQPFFFSLWAFCTTSGAIQSIRGCRERTDLYRAGAWSGFVGALLVVVFLAIQYFGYRSVSYENGFIIVGLSFLAGLVATFLVSSVTPLLEGALGYTTSLKLLELSNFNHPLLHSLMMKAPGTYHHSVIVGSLSEIAADRIKANSLLARVSAYYHDIGKMSKPLYFIENQSPNNNPHDHLKPSMSAKILFSHVKNGARLGRDYNLGKKIVDVIEQHHGTTLTHYFFTRAQKSNDPTGEPQENDFRYPGPKPQTREAAIVMICDACEAATRSIADPSPSKIQTMVHMIISRRLLDDQFSECDITLLELQLVEESITRTLVSLYHHRIEYPGNPKVETKTNTAPLITDPMKQKQG